MFVGDHHTDLASTSPQSASNVDHCVVGGGSEANADDLNVLNEVNNDLFLMPSGSGEPQSDANHSSSNNIDQYFMASLLDTEQEVVVQ